MSDVKIKTDDVFVMFIALDLLMNKKPLPPELYSAVGGAYMNIKGFLNEKGLIKDATNKDEKPDDLVLVED